MFPFRKPAPPPPPKHSLKVKFWPPEASADGALGIVGLIAIILIVVLGSSFGLPAAKALIAAITRPAQTMLAPPLRPPD